MDILVTACTCVFRFFISFLHESKLILITFEISRWCHMFAGSCATIMYAWWCTFTAFLWDWCHHIPFSKHGIDCCWQEYCCDIFIWCDALIRCISNWNSRGGNLWNVNMHSLCTSMWHEHVQGSDTNSCLLLNLHNLKFQVVFLHPVHNYALISYDPLALGTVGISLVRAAELLPGRIKFSFHLILLFFPSSLHDLVRINLLLFQRKMYVFTGG